MSLALNSLPLRILRLVSQFSRSHGTPYRPGPTVSRSPWSPWSPWTVHCHGPCHVQQRPTVPPGLLPTKSCLCTRFAVSETHADSRRLTQTHADSRRLTQTEDKLSKSVARVLEHFLVEVISLQLKAFDVPGSSTTEVFQCRDILCT